MDPARQTAPAANPDLSDAYYVHRTLFRGFPLNVALLIALVVVVLIPIWSVKYFPSTDGGAHVASADVLLKYLGSGSAAYREYFELTKLPVPNSGGHFALAALMLLFSPAVAEKVFVSLYLLLLP